MSKIRIGGRYKLAAAGLALTLLLLGGGGRNLFSKYREYRTLNAKKAALERQKAELLRQVAEVKRHPAVEQAARRELNMIRPGETEYRFEKPAETDR
jgi:cell division protein FtsB